VLLKSALDGDKQQIVTDALVREKRLATVNAMTLLTAHVLDTVNAKATQLSRLIARTTRLSARVCVEILQQSSTIPVETVMVAHV
jgi:hypothetical protein